MVSFHRVGSSALYVPEPFVADPVASRLGLFLDDPGPTPVLYPDVVDRSTLVAWAGGVDGPRFLAELDDRLSDLRRGRIRVVFFAADLRRAVVLETKADATVPAATEVAVDDTFSVQLADGSRPAARPDRLTLEPPPGRRHRWIFVREGGGTKAFAVTGDLVLPLDGDGRGTFELVLALTDAELDAMGVHLRYSRVGPLEDDDEGERSAAVDSQRYPIFRQRRGDAVRLAVRFDPLAPGDPGRTRLSFEPAQRLLSDFETVLGHEVTLEPLDGARLVLDRAVRSVDENGHVLLGRSYLTPDGAFELGVEDGAGAEGPGAAAAAGPAEPHLLVTGVSTSEFVPFRPRQNGRPGDRLVFHPKRAATDRRTLPPGAAALAAPTGAELFLSDLATTAWVSIEGTEGGPADDKRLHTQPEDLTLYADAPAAAGMPRQMTFASQDRPGLSGRPFPMAPFLGVRRLADDAGEHLRQESQVLSPARQAELPAAGQAAAGLAAGEPVSRVSPQGFPVTLQDGQWRKLVLARTRAGDFGFEDMGPEFTQALVRDRTFLVATRLGKGLANPIGDLDLAGWGLGAKAALEGGDGGQDLGLPPTTLIFKYHDVALEDLVEDPEAWVGKETFNDDWREVQRRLRDYVDFTRRRHRELETQSPGSSPYGPFLRRVGDPGWNGVVVMNAAVIPRDLPKSIKGLLPGIKLERFRAHHFGVELSRLGQDGFDVRQSSLFGVIDYPMPPLDEPVKEPVRDIADIEVETLRLQFESSEVRRFDCRVKLWLAKVFGDDVERLRPGTDDPAEDNFIVFDGRYESRLAPDGSKIETYIFIHEGDYRYRFESQILHELRVTRLQLTTVDAAGTKVKTRLALWGSLSFEEVDVLDVFSIERLEFADLGITIDFDFSDLANLKRIFNLDLGALRFDLPDAGLRGGLLGKLPFRLKFFQFSPGDFDLELPDLGYFKFGPGGTAFRFGLGFHLDLGSLGALAKKLEGFVLETLLGWLPDTGGGPRFAFGFKLQGSGADGLDLGIEGVLKLLVDHYKIEKLTLPPAGPVPERTIYALQAVGCRLEVLGRRFPAESELQLFLFVDPAEATAGRLGHVGWFGKLGTKDEGTSGSGGLEVPLVALGQRVNAYPRGGVPSTRQVVDHIKDEIGKLDDAGKLVSLVGSDALRFAPERGWTVALRAALWELADLDLLFLDPDLYGIYLKIPAGDETLFALDVLYRRITDELGVYATELTVPDAWRQWQFGVFSLTLPVIGLDVYTNGDFLVDVGYPWDLDFSRSCTLQAYVFIGSGGLYYGQLEAASSPFVPSPRNPHWTYDPVVQAGFAGRFGLGREFRKGALRAGLSVTVFSTLEGAWGRRRELTHRHDDGSPVPPADYFRLAGTTGILGEVFGYVDFGIVKAGVDLRVWVAFGWVLETWQPVILSLEAGVRVRVRVVIGRIKIFGKKIEIKITFSFSARLRFEWPLGKGNEAAWLATFGPRGAGLAAAPPPATLLANAVLEDAAPPRLLDWDQPLPVYTPPRDLDLLLTPDVTLVGGNPHAVLFLTLGGGPESDGDPAETPFAVLARALAAWAAWTCFPERRDQGDPAGWTISNADLALLEACLAIPASLARGASAPGDGSFEPLDMAALLAFLGTNFRFRLRDPADGETLGGAVFPMFPDLALRFAHGNTVLHDVRLWQESRVSEDYERDLDAHFERLRILLEERRGSGVAGLAAVERPVSEVLFEDYFQLLVRSLVGALADTHGDDEPAPTLGQRFTRLAGEGPSPGAGSGWAQLAAGVGRFFLHGLRVPDPAGNGSRALLELAGQQRPFFPQGIPAAGPALPYRLEVTKRSDSPLDWLEATASPIEVDVDGLRRLAGAEVPRELTAVEVRSPVRPRPRRHGLREATAWSHDAAARGTLWSLPPEVLARIARRPETLTVHRTEDGERLDNADGPALDGRWAVRIPLRITQVRREGGAAAVANVYRLLPAAAAVERSVQAILDSPRLAGASLHLLYAAEGEGLVSQSTASTELWRTDLSTEPRPEVAALAAEELRVAAGLDEPAAFLDLLRRAARVRSDGYFLGYRTGDGGGLPDRLFQGEDERAAVRTADLTLLVLFAANPADAVAPPVNAVLLEAPAAGASERPVHYLRSPDDDFELALPPGTVGFRVYRRQPERLPEGAGSDRVELATRFHLLDYDVAATATLEGIDAEDVLPIAPSEVEAPSPGSEPRPRPAGVEEGDWCYEHVLPAYQLSGAAPADRSLYDGVGEDLRVRIGLRDLYGNRLGGPPVAELAVPVRYFDRLQSPTEWPSSTVGYGFDAQAPGQVTVEARFDPRGFLRQRDPEEWLGQDEAERDRIDDVRAAYRRAKAQLEDPRTRLSLSTSLDDGEEHEVGKAGLVALVDAVDAFLAGLPDSGPRAPAIAPWTVRFPVTLAEDRDLVEVRVRLHLRRPQELAHPRAVETGLEEVWQVDVTLPPRIADEEPAVAEPSGGLKALAAAFESAFPHHKLAAGLGDADARALWAVHRRTVTFEVDPDRGRPSVFALPPLSTELQSGDVEVPPLENGAPPAVVRVADVDLDAQTREVLREVEAFLEPDVAAFARRLEPRAFDRVVRDKDRIAERLAGGLTAVFADPDTAPDRDRIDLARHLLRDRMAADLRDGYDVDAAMLLPLRRVLPGGDGGGALVFGRLVTAVEEVRLIPGNLDLSADRLTLPVLVDARRETERGHVRLDDLRYRLTHVGRRTGTDADGEPRIAWLQLLEAESVDLRRPRIEVDVPIPIRRFPESPTLRAHGVADVAASADASSHLAGGSFEDRIAEARRFTYRVDFDHLDVDQDTVFLEIRYNHRFGQAAALLADTRSILAALTGYRHHREAVWEGLRQGMAGNVDEAEARRAVRRFQLLVERVSGSFTQAFALAGGLPAERERFQIDEDPADAGRRRLRICRLSQADDPAFGGGFEVLPTDAKGNLLPTEPDPRGEPGCSAVLYTPPATGADARLYRRMLRHDLDVLRTENAWAGVELWRNLLLVPDQPSADAFVYRTAPVRFGEPFTPYLDIHQEIAVPRSSTDWESADELRSSLEGDIAAMLRAVTSPALVVGRQATVELRWGFESGVLVRALGPEGAIRAPHPVGMMPPFELSEQGGAFDPERAARAAASLLVDWWRQSPPPGNGRTGAFVADLRIYGGLQVSGRPSLRLRRLVLPLARP